MTTVAAFYDPVSDVVGIAADSAVTGEYKYRLGYSKIFVAGDLAIGVCGLPPPMGFAPGELAATEENVERLAAMYLEAADDWGHGAVDSDGVRTLPVGGIIVGRGISPRLLGSAGDLYPVLEGYAAIGSGGPLALGILFNERSHRANESDYNPVPIDRLLIDCLTAACWHDPNSAGPVSLVTFFGGDDATPPTSRLIAV